MFSKNNRNLIFILSSCFISVSVVVSLVQYLWLGYLPFSKYGRSINYNTRNTVLAISSPNAFMESLRYNNNILYSPFDYSDPNRKLDSMNFANRRRELTNPITATVARNSIQIQVKESNNDMYINHAKFFPTTPIKISKDKIIFTGLDCRAEIVGNRSIIFIAIRGRESSLWEKPSDNNIVNARCNLSNLPQGKYYIDYLEPNGGDNSLIPTDSTNPIVIYSSPDNSYWQAILDIPKR